MLIDFLSNFDLCFFCRIVNCGACNANSYHLCKYGMAAISCFYNLLKILSLMRNVTYRLGFFSDSWQVCVCSSCFLDFGMVTFIFLCILEYLFFFVLYHLIVNILKHFKLSWILKSEFNSSFLIICYRYETNLHNLCSYTIM